MSSRTGQGKGLAAITHGKTLGRQSVAMTKAMSSSGGAMTMPMPGQNNLGSSFEMAANALQADLLKPFGKLFPQAGPPAKKAGGPSVQGKTQPKSDPIFKKPIDWLKMPEMIKEDAFTESWVEK